MKGKATTEHNFNEVEWVNGFRSRMPDWITARECGAANDMMVALFNCRTMLFHLNTPGNFFKVGDRECVAIEHAKLDKVFEEVQAALEKATGMEQTAKMEKFAKDHPVEFLESISDAILNNPPMLQKPFPKPPGF